MITGKQRAFLKGLAQKREVSLIIGKNGCSESVIEQLEQILEKRELMKIKLLDNVTEDKEEIVQRILDNLQADFVQFIGSKFTFYRPAKEPKIELPK